jgi:hypothetical protein
MRQLDPLDGGTGGHRLDERARVLRSAVGGNSRLVLRVAWTAPWVNGEFRGARSHSCLSFRDASGAAGAGWERISVLKETAGTFDVLTASRLPYRGTATENFSSRTSHVPSHK